MGDVWNYKENDIIIHVQKYPVNKERDYVTNENIFFKKECFWSHFWKHE